MLVLSNHLIFKEGFEYPTTVTVSSLSEDTEKYVDTVGTYNIVPGETYNGRPVWKHRTSELLIYYLGTYVTRKLSVILYCLDNLWHCGLNLDIDKKNKAKLFGWKYSDSSYIWPNTSQLFIIGDLTYCHLVNIFPKVLFLFRLSINSNYVK